MARVSASVGGSSVATGSPSQTDFIKTGQVDAGVLEEGCGWSQADKLASIDGIRAESEAVACDLGSCRRRMRHAIVATTSVRRHWFLGIQICMHSYMCVFN